MPFARLLRCQRLASQPCFVRRSRSLHLRLSPVRCFSASRSYLDKSKDDSKPDYSIRYLEQNDDGKFTDQTNSEAEVAEIKAQIEVLEKRIKVFEEKEGLANKNLDEEFAPIFDRLSKDAETRFKDLPQEGEEELETADRNHEIDPQNPGRRITHDFDKIFKSLPKDLQAGISKSELQEMIKEEEAAEDAQLAHGIQQDEHVQQDSNFKEQDFETRFRSLLFGKADQSLHTEQGDDAKEQDFEKRVRNELFGNSDQSLDVQVPEHVKIHLDGFNRAMRSVVSQSKDHKSIGQFWAKYELCKKYVPGFLEELPSRVWDIVWLSQWKGNIIHESRKQHLWTIVTDMVEVDRPLNHDQQLVYIEYQFSEDSKTLAMKLWQEGYNELEDNDPRRDEYRDLGVRLHVEAGLLPEAQSLIFGGKRRSPIKAEDVAVLVAAWANKPDEKSLKIAWTLYLDMRERLGDKMKLDDYDQIAMTFLGANRGNLALAVFKDMVLSVGIQSRNTQVQVRSIALLKQLQEGAKSREEVDAISLDSLASIPRQFENKYFYASWIKRLIGLDEVHATLQILELMFQRGIRPDARHLNGIMGAWLRGQNKHDHQLALQIGWSMVKERLKFVARRNHVRDGNDKIVDELDSGKLVPPYISRNLPPATIETFCLLLLYYERRSMNQSVDYVKSYLQDAEISPNSFFMNHLLFAELRKQNVAGAWHIFKTMRQSVTPDLETYSALWGCEKIFTSGQSLKAPEFPRSRLLFRRMIEWFDGLAGRDLRQAQNNLDTDLYNKIIQCFCFQKDIQGTIVALYALRDKFHYYPTPDTERMLWIQLARMGEGSVKRHRRVRQSNRFSANGMSVQDFSKIVKTAELVKAERVEALKAQGIDDESLEGQARMDEDLWRIVEVLRIALRHHAGVMINEEAPQEQQLNLVAAEMGVPNIDMDNPA